MKIAVASEGKDESSMVSSISGRAPYYLIYENGKLVETVKNPFVTGGGAGFSVAQMLSNKGVEIVIAEEFGPNMRNMLNSKGIDMKIISNKNVKDAVGEMEDGKT